MTEKKRPVTEFIPITAPQAEAPATVPEPAQPPPVEPPAPAAPAAPPAATHAPPSDKPFSGRKVSPKTAQMRVAQTKYVGLMLALVALFVILLIVAAAYLVFVGVAV